jgi:glutathione S-transferase
VTRPCSRFEESNDKEKSVSELKLYNLPLSGNCYKVRLLLSMLGVEYEKIPVDLVAGENQTPEFKQLNPRGQLPVLSDGDTVIWDSMAILVYLARRNGNEKWLPTEALAEARVMQWLAVSENELLTGLARSRAARRFNRPFDPEQCRLDSTQGVGTMEIQLQQNEWLAAGHPTIADIACYPYVNLADEADFSLQPYPAVRAWLQRVEGLPGWEPML